MTGKEISSPIIFECSAKGFLSNAAPFRRFFDFLIDDANRPETVVNNPLLRAGWDDMLLSMILALPNSYSHSVQCANRLNAGIALVRRAEEYLEANASNPVSISDLVAEFQCTRSELFNAFRKYRGYAPLQFLAESRLRLARKALLCATTEKSVTSIALACGFSHLGRFSTAYRKRFGEKPSETIQSN